MKKQNILHKNYLKKKYLNKNFYSKFFNNIFNEIKKNCDVSQNTYHVLSKKFSFNFKLQDLKKFNKFGPFNLSTMTI